MVFRDKGITDSMRRHAHISGTTTVLYLGNAPRTHPALYHFGSVTLPTILAKHAALGMSPFMLAISTIDASVLTAACYSWLYARRQQQYDVFLPFDASKRRKARCKNGVPQTTKLGLHILELRIRLFIVEANKQQPLSLCHLVRTLRFSRFTEEDTLDVTAPLRRLLKIPCLPVDSAPLLF